MSLVFLAIAIYGAAVVETSLGDVLVVRHVLPDLFALLAVIWLFCRGGSRGFLVAAAVGLAYDLTAAGPLGIGMAAFAAVGYAIGWLRGKTDADHLIVRLTVLLLSATAIALVEATAWRLLGETTLSWPTLAIRGATVGVYTTVVGVPLLMILSWQRRKAAPA